MLRKYAHPTCRRKEYRDGESLSSDTIPSDPGGSTPNAMKVAYWNRVDRKLAFPRPQKNEVYIHSKKECVVLTCTHGLLCPIK